MKETHYKDADDEDAPATEKTEEQKAQTKVVNPRGFFQNLIKKSDAAKATPTSKAEDEDKEKKVADFKKKLRLDNIES